MTEVGTFIEVTATRFLAACLAAAGGLTVSGCAGSSGTTSTALGQIPEPATLTQLGDARPGDLVGLVADDERRVVTWLHRVDGTIHELSIDDDDARPMVVATVEVSTESQQGGLLDQVLTGDGRRVIAFTNLADELEFASLDGDSLATMWNAGAAGSGAIGGKIVIGPAIGSVTVSVGRNVDWFTSDLTTSFDPESLDDAAGRLGDQGALLTLPDDPTRAEIPKITSFGYTNAWAVAVAGDGETWVWDNAAGPDPDQPSVDDVERTGRADVIIDRQLMTRSVLPDRAPADMVELPDGRLGVCGFLDNELRAYEVVDGPDGVRTELERAGTIMPCNTGVAVFADGTIVTAAQTIDGETLQILRP